MSGESASELEYVGFWARSLASLIDSLWLTPIVILLGELYASADTKLMDQLLQDPGSIDVAALTAQLTPNPMDIAVQYVLPTLLLVLFWLRRDSTPGKMVLHARIVDAETGAAPSKRQLLIRYLGYYVSMLPLFWGFISIGIDPRKQGWHDKLAGTVVVRPKARATQAVSFSGGAKP